MTESTKYPEPFGLEIDALHDAAWDIRDYGVTTLHPGENYEQWMYWLKRYEGFGDEELEVKNPTAMGAIIIGYRD